MGWAERAYSAKLARSRPTTAASPAPSRVVEIYNRRVVSGRLVHRHILAEMLERGLQVLTDLPTASDGWRSLFSDEDVIGLKFNHSGADELGTTATFAEVLVDSLLAADLRPDRLVLIEAPPGALTRKTATPVIGWTRTAFDFGSGKDALAAVVEQVTAIINIPFLKTHNIAGMSGCLKNLSHAFIRHPAWFHGNGCDPYVADIVAIPQLRRKLRLHLVNALRIVVDHGPQARQQDIDPARSILLSFDPVAADTVGQDMLDARRLQRNLPRLAEDAGKLPILVTAANRGLGMNDPDALDHRKLLM